MSQHGRAAWLQGDVVVAREGKDDEHRNDFGRGGEGKKEENKGRE